MNALNKKECKNVCNTWLSFSMTEKAMEWVQRNSINV